MTNEPISGRQDGHHLDDRIAEARAPWSLMRTGFGPLLIASVALLTIVFAGIGSPQYGIGYAAGKLVTSLAFGLPVFLLLRYATRVGRRLSGLEPLNLLCLIVAGAWVMQVVLVAATPAVLSTLATKKADRAAVETSETAEPPSTSTASEALRNKDGSTNWDAFTPASSSGPWQRDWSKSAPPTAKPSVSSSEVATARGRQQDAVAR